MRKLTILFSAVIALLLFASIASAELVPTRLEWKYATEADTIGKNNADSAPVVAYSYGNKIIISSIRVQGYNKAGQSDSDIELVLYALVYGDSGPIHSSTVYDGGLKVVDSYRLKAYGDSDMYLSQQFDFSSDFSDLAGGGKTLGASEALIFAVQVKDGNYYSSLPGTTDLQATVTVKYRYSNDPKVQ